MQELHDRLYPDKLKANNIINFRFHLYRYVFALPHCKFGGKTLDAGCGAGYGSRMLCWVSSKVVAVDHSTKAIEYAKQYYPSPLIEWRVDNVMNIKEQDFDNIIAFEMLEHNKNSEGVLSFLMSRLKSPGKGIFSVPVMSRAQGHLRVFTEQKAIELFANLAKREGKGQDAYQVSIHFQYEGDVVGKRAGDSNLVIAVITKRK